MKFCQGCHMNNLQEGNSFQSCIIEMGIKGTYANEHINLTVQLRKWVVLGLTYLLDCTFFLHLTYLSLHGHNSKLGILLVFWILIFCICSWKDRLSNNNADTYYSQLPQRSQTLLDRMFIECLIYTRHREFENVFRCSYQESAQWFEITDISFVQFIKPEQPEIVAGLLASWLSPFPPSPQQSKFLINMCEMNDPWAPVQAVLSEGDQNLDIFLCI